MKKESRKKKQQQQNYLEKMVNGVKIEFQDSSNHVRQEIETKIDTIGEEVKSITSKIREEF